jgi:hypothetical protein
MANREIPSPPKGTRVNGRKLWGDVLGKYELEQHELAFVLTGGNAGQRPAPGWALAASISGAIEALTRELALELAPIRSILLHRVSLAVRYGDRRPRTSNPPYTRALRLSCQSGG